MNTSSNSSALPPLAIYFPCSKYSGRKPKDTTTTTKKKNDKKESDDDDSSDPDEVNHQLFENTTSWLPKNGDLRTTLGQSKRQDLPEFTFYHWREVTMRATNVNDKNNETVLPPSDLKETLCSEDCPVILFSHGNCTHCNFYSNFAVELASRGAVVVVPWHTDGSSSGCILEDGTCIEYRHHATNDESNEAAVAIKEEQLEHRIQEIERVAKAMADGTLWKSKKYLGWFDDDDQVLLNECLERMQSSFGISLLGHSFGAATVFGVCAERMMMMNHHTAKNVAKFRNYICYDLWSFPIRSILTKLEKIITTKCEYEFPFLELQTSDEWESSQKNTHMKIVQRVEKLWKQQQQQQQTEMKNDDDKHEKYIYKRKQGTDHLSLSDGGVLSPRYFRHKESKRRGLWTDDRIFICEYAVEALQSILKCV